MRRLRLGMAQINTTVGDFKGNTRKILKAIADGSALGVDLLTFPELAICGYPPEDLLLKPEFTEGCPSQTGSRAARTSFWPYALLASTK